MSSPTAERINHELPIATLQTTNASNPFVDLSGISTESFENPYDALIEATHNDPAQLQTRYETHRTARNAQQKEKLLDPKFPGMILDTILMRIENTALEPGYVDPRHCLVFWARPPQKVRTLIDEVQRRLKTAAPNLWLMPQDHLHMTALEMTHSRTADEIERWIQQMQPKIPEITDFTLSHRARLVKPMIGFDAQAIALSFVPAAGEGLSGTRTAHDDGYTYHHLRRDLFDLCQSTGAKVDSRYVVPSAHLTIGRFIHAEDFQTQDGSVDKEKVKQLMRLIEDTNQWLHDTYWASDSQSTIPFGGEWIIGEEKGLDCRKGTLWYGHGTTVRLGAGF